MIKLRKPVVGEALFAVWVNSRGLEKECKEVVVTKVGRKYFYVSDLVWEPKFHIETWRENDNFGIGTWKLYETKQAYLDEVEADRIYQTIKSNCFGSWNNKIKLSLDQLRRIQQIINE